MTTDWMQDPDLANIEPFKLQFLQALIFESSQLKKEQMMPFLMAVMKRGKEKNVQFTDEEFRAVVTVLKKHATPEELAKIEKVMALRK